MACPYFDPGGPLDPEAWRKSPRVPLGDPHSGVCRADPAGEWLPDDATLRDCCNAGYARNRCSRFPAGDGPDAFRFAITADVNGVLTVFYVSEHDHRTLEHGSLRFSTAAGRFLAEPPGAILSRQATAYVAGYLRRRPQSADAGENPRPAIT